MIDLALSADPDFLIDRGDLIEGGTSNPAILEIQWAEYLGLINDLEIPFYHTPGNHDLWHPGQLIPYLEKIGAPTYSIDHRDLHLVILDNSRWDPDSSEYFTLEQLLWLDADLAANQDKTIMIFSHKPWWDLSISDSTLVDPFHSYLLSRNVSAVFSGHYHNHYQTEYDQIRYVISGRSGGGDVTGHPAFTSKDIRYQSPDLEPHGFYQVEISDTISINFVELP